MAEATDPAGGPTGRQARLGEAYAAACGSDEQAAWLAFYQVLAGTPLIIALEGGAGTGAGEGVQGDVQEGGTVRPMTVQHEGTAAILAFTDMDGFAATLSEPTGYAEMDGAELCGLLGGQAVPVLIHCGAADSPIPIDIEAQAWIAATYGAEVTHRAAEGVSVTAPALPDLALMQALGQSVGALGADCPEAWLVTLSGAETEPELVLVLGLSDQAARMEAEIAETVTRSIQAVTEQRFAVACPGRGSALMASARRTGIGIGGGEGGEV